MKYDFKCTKCRRTQEKEIPISKYDQLKDKQLCSNCGAYMKRVYNRISGTIYNCKGFYDTDSRKVNSR